MLNKVIIPRKFRFYLVFHIVIVVGLLRRGVVHRLVATFYLYRGDSDMQNRFDQLNISNYDR